MVRVILRRRAHLVECSSNGNSTYTRAARAFVSTMFDMTAYGWLHDTIVFSRASMECTRAIEHIFTAENQGVVLYYWGIYESMLVRCNRVEDGEKGHRREGRTMGDL
ncbi:hypothetical protein Tco_0685389 [Tanacetum coccineum]